MGKPTQPTVRVCEGRSGVRCQFVFIFVFVFVFVFVFLFQSSASVTLPNFDILDEGPLGSTLNSLPPAVKVATCSLFVFVFFQIFVFFGRP